MEQYESFHCHRDPGTGLVTPVSQGTTDITYTVTSGCGAPCLFQNADCDA